MLLLLGNVAGRRGRMAVVVSGIAVLACGVVWRGRWWARGSEGCERGGRGRERLNPAGYRRSRSRLGGAVEAGGGACTGIGAQ